MARQLVVLFLFMVGIGVLCTTQAPTAAKGPAASQTKTAASKPRTAVESRAKPARASARRAIGARLANLR